MSSIASGGSRTQGLSGPSANIVHPSHAVKQFPKKDDLCLSFQIRRNEWLLSGRFAALEQQGPAAIRIFHQIGL